MTQSMPADTADMTEQARTASRLCAAVADEMRVARQLIEELAGILVADESFVLKYIEQFQTFDLIMQHVEESATLLERFAKNQSISDALDGVRLTAVQERLRTTLG